MVWLLLAIPIVVAIGLATVSSPRRTAWFIGFTLATNAADVLHQRFGVVEYTTLLAAAALGFGLLQLMTSLPRLRRPRTLPLGVATAVTVAVASALAGPFVASQPEISIEAVNRLLINLFLAAAVLTVTRRPPTIVALLKGFVVGAVVLGMLTTVQAVTGLQDQHLFGFARWSAEEIAGFTGESFRATGAFRDDANQYGQVLVMAIGCAIGLGWLRQEGDQSPFARQVLARRGAVAVMAIAVTQTASRTALLALAVVLCMAMVAARPSPRQWSLVGLTAMVLTVGPFGVGGRLASLGAVVGALFDSNIAVESSAGGRLSVMASAVAMFADHPLLGVGYGAYSDRYLEYSRAVGLETRERDLSAHSLPLEVLAEEGLLGATAWFAFVVFASVALVRIRHTTVGQSLLYMTVAYMATGLLLHDIYGRLRWSLVALLFHAARMAGSRVSDFRPLRVAVITDEGLAVLRGRKKTTFSRRHLGDGQTPNTDIELGVVETVSVWPDLRRLKSRDLIGDSNSDLLHQMINRVATRIALFRFDPHVVHAMGGSSTLRTAVAHRRETGGRLVIDVTDLLIAELLAGRRRLTAARLIPSADYVVTGIAMSHDESQLLKIGPDQQVTDPRLGHSVRANPDDIVCDHETYLDLIAGQPGNGRSIAPEVVDLRSQQTPV